MAGQEHLGAERGHLAEADRPLAGVALHLLRVAAVGAGPDEEVAGAEHLAARVPHPGGVVGLALVVVELPRLAADGQRVVVAVDLVGLAVLRGPVRPAELELPLVDDAVVPSGEHVALEARAARARGPRRGAAPSRWRPPPRRRAPCRRRGRCGRACTRRCRAGGRSSPDALVVAGRHHLVAGVDQQQAVVRVEGADVAERRAEGGPVGHLGQAEVLGDRVVAADVGGPLAVPELLRDLQEVCHACRLAQSPPWRSRASARVRSAFYDELAANNSRDWWLANKRRYEDEVRRPMEELLEDVAAEFGEASCSGPTGTRASRRTSRPTRPTSPP